MFCIRLFGKFEVSDENGTPIAISGAKTQELIAFLALCAEMPPTRDRIINLFWGDRFTDQARQSLGQAIAKIRKLLPSDKHDILSVDQDRIGLNPECVQVDVDTLSRLANDETPDAVLEAVELLRGPLLDGLYGQQAEFEDWISSERQRVNELVIKVLERAAGIHQRNGDTEAALGIARRVARLNPWSDAA